MRCGVSLCLLLHPLGTLSTTCTPQCCVCLGLHGLYLDLQSTPNISPTPFFGLKAMMLRTLAVQVRILSEASQRAVSRYSTSQAALEAPRDDRFGQLAALKLCLKLPGPSLRFFSSFLINSVTAKERSRFSFCHVCTGILRMHVYVGQYIYTRARTYASASRLHRQIHLRLHVHAQVHMCMCISISRICVYVLMHQNGMNTFIC